MFPSCWAPRVRDMNDLLAVDARGVTKTYGSLRRRSPSKGRGRYVECDASTVFIPTTSTRRRPCGTAVPVPHGRRRVEVVGMKTVEASHSTYRPRPLLGLRRRRDP